MARKKKTIENEVINRMKTLGVYKDEYRNTIIIFADMLHHYEVLREQFEASDYAVEEPYTNKSGATNMRKTPLLTALEKLRMDIAAYSSLLCLNPRELKKTKSDPPGRRGLAQLLSSWDGGG